MADCPHCEYYKKRAQIWRDEAYKQAGHPLPEREWVGLTDEDLKQLSDRWRIIYGGWVEDFAKEIEAKLKEKNNG